MSENKNSCTNSSKVILLSNSSSTGVYAGQLIPKSSRSKEFSTLNLMSSSARSEVALYCTIDSDGTFDCKTSTAWMRKIKLSEDIHSYNALFEQQCGNVSVRAVKDIQSGDEIVVWFSEEISILMSLPFLTPFNIQGNNRYTCHICQMTFETPNPLKVHLALACGRHSIDTLWIRLHYASKTALFTQHFQHPSPQRISPIAAPSTFTTNTRLSAFKPISSTSTTTSSSTTLQAIFPMQSEPETSLQQSSNLFNAAERIEAIVSNMGASKQGHLCIYCGKIYSRKYGLKIHIRTHTGFKPLKCKFCLRPFGDPSNLNKHVRLHLQNNSGSHAAVYKCNLCSPPKSLARRRDLQRHMESRHRPE